MQSMEFNQLFPTAHPIQLTGVIRSQPEDFQVQELNEIPLSDEGEHVWLYVRKIGENTDWVARQLAKLTGVSRRQVGYAGLKDRHAVTEQWFSIQLPNPSALAHLSDKLPSSIQILEQRRHRKKLQKGNLSGNRFVLRIRQVDGLESEAQQTYVSERLQLLSQQGVPNYFGPQRFGHDMGNIAALQAWFDGAARAPKQHLKSLYLSAGRSWVFNHVLAERVRHNLWYQAMPGDVFQLQGSHSWFQGPQDEHIQQRLVAGDIHPTGPLWGDGTLATTEEAALLEQRIAMTCADISSGLEQRRLQQERRALRFLLKDLSHQWLPDGGLQLSFVLPAGAFATSVLRELFDFQDASKKM